MFDSAETGNTLTKEAFRELVPGLRVDLINQQYDLMTRPFPVLIVLAGDDIPGIGEIADRLQEWMDGRYIDTIVFVDPTEEEQVRPPHWRYWRCLPPAGKIGLHLGGGVHDVLRHRLFEGGSDEAFERHLVHMRKLEQELADDGMLILKFWLHLPKDAFRKRLKKAKKDPDKAWRLEPIDWQIFEQYDEIMPLGERLVSETSTDHAPWQVVESTDPQHRDITVAKAIRAALGSRLSVPDGDPGPARAVTTLPVASGAGMLSQVDLAASLERREYKERLADLQRRLNGLSRRARKKQVTAVVVFEGWDAAGKGGCIRRMTGAMSVRDYQVIPIAAPTDEEHAHHYLWRFWRQLPRGGRMIVFDRSWYGRVLVERVEGFATEDQWRRAYEEINDFESHLVEHGWPVLKFWLHLDPEEQLRRFKDREKTAYKKYKITDEDYRNRGKWDQYVEAANEMFARTSTPAAPWSLIAANDKRWARVRVLETMCEGLEKAL